MDVDSSSILSSRIAGPEMSIVLGRTSGSSVSYEGIDPNSPKIVKRSETVDKIISHLQTLNVVLIKSPPMTGKTSMATIVVDKLRESAKKKSLIISLSMVDLSRSDTNWDFVKQFESRSGLQWSELYTTSQKRTIYIVFDEAQLIYNMKDENGKLLPSHNSKVVWDSIKSILSDISSDIKVLLFAAYGSSHQNAELSTPVQFEAGKTMFGIDVMNYKDEELREYVEKNLVVSNILSRHTSASLNEDEFTVFCRNLKTMTGSHVGLCYATINCLNDMFRSDMKYNTPVSPSQVIQSVWHNKVFLALRNTRALSVFQNVNIVETEFLKKHFFNDLSSQNEDISLALVRKGVLLELDGKIVFSSPAMKRTFLESMVGPINRAQQNPSSLQELVYLVMASIDYEHLKSSLGKSKSSEILLERAWQMEFYKTALRCTANMFVSADVGGMFDTNGAIDFTIHSNNSNVFWGIELLRESDRLSDHVERFKVDGRYKNLCKLFSSSCLIDFRRRETKEANPRENSEALAICDNLFILSYDTDFSNLICYSKEKPEGLAISKI